MTTPTREQVVQIVMQAHAPGLLAPGYSESLAQIIALARADLEATIAEQATEISKLISAVADHVTVRAEQRQQLAAEQAYAEQLRMALDFARQKVSDLHADAGDGDCHYPIINDALDLKRDTTTLQEYGANLVDRVIDSINSEYHRPLAHIPDRIRKGEFK